MSVFAPLFHISYYFFLFFFCFSSFRPSATARARTKDRAQPAPRRLTPKTSQQRTDDETAFPGPLILPRESVITSITLSHFSPD